MSININNLKNALDNDEEKRLFEEYTETKDINIRNIIVEHNLKLVVHSIYKKFNNNTIDKEDLFMVGTIGLINAVENYSIHLKTKFSTYATKSIDNEISYYIYCYYRNYCSKSLNEKINNESEEELITTLKNKVDEEEKSINQIMIELRLKFLSEKEKDIVLSYFGALNYRKLTQEELSKKYSVSKASIYKIINIALKKMSKSVKKRPISIYDIFRMYDKNQIDYALSKMSLKDLNRLKNISLQELHSNGKEKDLYLKIKKYL